jgi:methylene-tetrahydromethanopterin dehydrogenase
MRDPYLLHMFNPNKNVSPFDVNMAYEADFDGVIPYTNVQLEDVHALTQDCIFSRGPSGVRRTGIFIGGRDFALAEEMLQAARKAMVPPFEVSVFADPSGAFTTAAALMASVEFFIKQQNKGGLEGKTVRIFGGTGPVGICAGVIAARCGADVTAVSYLGARHALEAIAEYNQKYATKIHAGDGSTTEAERKLLQDADVVIATAKAGIQILSKDQLQKAGKLIVAADVNAVPPLGLEGIGVHDEGKPIEGHPNQALGIGALGIGDLKYRVHHRLFQKMQVGKKPSYISFPEAFDCARKMVDDEEE